jgi:hypothetical protein
LEVNSAGEVGSGLAATRNRYSARRRRGVRLFPMVTMCFVGMNSFSCAEPATRNSVEWGLMPLLDGRLVSDLGLADTAAVMLVDPTHCFTCGGDVASWRSWAGESPRRSVAVVLLRSPSPRETEELARQRLPITGVLASRVPITSPTALLFTDGELRDVASGEGPVGALRGRWVQ